MAEETRPVSLRLAPRHIEQLKARAHTVSGTLTGVARELILTGLAGGDNKASAGQPPRRQWAKSARAVVDDREHPRRGQGGKNGEPAEPSAPRSRHMD